MIGCSYEIFRLHYKKIKGVKRNNTYSVGGLFAGIGGIELGFKQAGFDIKWANEIDVHACKTYQNNFDHTLINKDIRKVDFKKLPKIDILVGGFPCQTFSIAGKKEGFGDKDRGQMFFEVIKAIKVLKPKVIFLENVKGLVIHDKGKTLKTILEILQKEKYYVKYQVLNTKDYTDIPQNRERVFFVGFKNKKQYEKFEFPKKETKHKNFREFLEKDIDSRYIFTENTWQNKFVADDDKSNNLIYQYRYGSLRKTEHVPTIMCGHPKALFILDNNKLRYLTPRELLNYQGFPKSFKFPKDLSDQQKYKQVGNAVTVPLIKKIALQIKKALKDNK